MARYEQFVVTQIRENLYENRCYNVRGTITEMRKYAAEHNYGDGVVLYVGAGKGNLGFRKDYIRI